MNAHEPTLDDALAEARAARDRGTSQADHAAHPWVRLHLQHHLDELIATGQPFTADTLRERAGDPIATDPNLIGALILAASKAGRITRVGYRESQRPEARCRVLRVWRGTQPREIAP